MYWPSRPPWTGPAISRDIYPGSESCPPNRCVNWRTSGATVKLLKMPNGRCEPSYRPTTTLTEFVRWRDMTCRFPGCDAPAEVCDIDHTKPYPHGPTHPSNTKLYCRTHHLLKTFYTGLLGWTDRQFPDGTVSLDRSDRPHVQHRIRTAAHCFPRWPSPPAMWARSSSDDPTGDRGVMMPTRRQTREQDRRDRIAKERRERCKSSPKKRESGSGATQATNHHRSEPASMA